MNHPPLGLEGTLGIVLWPNVPAPFCKRDPKRKSTLLTVTPWLGRGVALAMQTGMNRDTQRTGKAHIIEGKWCDPQYGVRMSESLRSTEGAA